MTTLTLLLPDSLSAFIEAQAMAEGRGTTSEYVLSVLLETQKRKAWDKVEALVIEGLHSGPAIEVNAEFWAKMHKRLEGRE